MALFEIRAGQTTGSPTSRLPRQRSHCPVIVASGDSVCSVARRYGLSPHQLFGWRRPLREAAGGYYEEEVQVVPAVEDAVVPAAALGHERGACAENSVQTTVVHFAGAHSANMSAVILRDIRSFPSSP
nr:transposase [Bradyrhizobium sp. WSM3983]